MQVDMHIEFLVDGAVRVYALTDRARAFFAAGLGEGVEVVQVEADHFAAFLQHCPQETVYQRKGLVN